MSTVLGRMVSRHFLQRLRIQYSLFIDRDIRKISEFLHAKQLQLADTEKRSAARLLHNTLRGVAARKTRLMRFIKQLLRELHTIKPETSRFAPHTSGKGHTKSYSFSRITQE